jgi:hypothetical protein
MRRGVIVIAVLVTAAGVAVAQDTPECFGAAARDAANPCDNPDLHVSATPSPDDAPLLPALPCTFVRYRTPHVCAFATSKKRAKGSIALLGDSHAPAWRAAVDVLARNRRWRGLTLARSSCPFSTARRRGVSRKNAKTCGTWVRGVYAWFRRHREVRTVFFVNSMAYDFTTDPVAGYRAALDALPPSVRRIVVIRDNPKATIDTLPCVDRALRRRERPDRRCALDRAEVLPPDPAAEAAPLLTRGATIDLTRFFCDDARCYPVVGGALVYKDTSHITQVFSRTLGPYLAAEFRALSPSA